MSEGIALLCDGLLKCEPCTLHCGIVGLIQIILLGREVLAQALFGSSRLLPLQQPHENVLRGCRVIVPSTSVLMPELFLISAVNQTLLHRRVVDSSMRNCCDEYPIRPIPFTFTRCNMEAHTKRKKEKEKGKNKKGRKGKRKRKRK